MEQEGRDVADMLAGFDVEGGLVGRVAREKGACWVKVEFYGRKLSVLLRDLGVEEGRDGRTWEQQSAIYQDIFYMP